jgi:hypothetical protein
MHLIALRCVRCDVQLAMAVRVLYKYMDGLSEGSADALSQWLAHHCSNFDYQWIWSEWCGSTGAAVFDTLSVLASR